MLSLAIASNAWMEKVSKQWATRAIAKMELGRRFNAKMAPTPGVKLRPGALLVAGLTRIRRPYLYESADW